MSRRQVNYVLTRKGEQQASHNIYDLHPDKSERD